jgi:uncharacterized protein YndB with AHSA1/START domain
MSLAETRSETRSEDFVISRVFDAPRELVWKCFTDPAHMNQWWGPKGSIVTQGTMDLRPGGIFHYRLEIAGGAEIWGKMVYREIKPRDQIVFINSFSDEAGGTTHHPMASTWPLEMLTIFTFEDVAGGKTRFTVRQSSHNASEEERKTFDANHDSLNQGWGGTLDKLAGYLPKAK